MERSLSRESSSATHPTSNEHPHKRNASVKVNKKALGPSVISLFVSNLRLLDLDILSDWPNISVSSFGTQDSRTRIKCVEYALYQLFRLYNPEVTAEKLKPFFPPLEPLQSVNLRAALFRCLNELKKTGALSKETVLRKSMLDDCQGERFWEVCLCFSALVLRRASHERKGKHARSTVERIGAAHSLSSRQKESMLPLAIAHRSALYGVLEERQRKKEKYVRLQGLLSEKDRELKQRKVASRQAQKTKLAHPEKLTAVEQAVEKSWIGSSELKEALVHGDTCAKGDGLLVESFEQLWLQDSDKGSIVSNGAEVGLLQDLSSKATQQSVRLSMWQNYLDRLIAAKPTAARANDKVPASKEWETRFDRHRSLNLKESFENEEDQPRPPPAKHRSAPRYDDILNAMREELRKHSAAVGTAHRQRPNIQLLKRAQTQPVPPLRRDFEPQAAPGATSHHSRSPSQTAVPIGQRLGRRVSSQSKSYEKPKVEGQRDPIPLKAELFSPLKENRRSLTTLSALASSLPSPAEEMDSESSRVDVSSDSVASAPNERGNMISAASEAALITDTAQAEGAIASVVTTMSQRGLDQTRYDFKLPALPERKAPAPPKDARPSLAERTRMSIAFNSSEDVSGFLPDFLAIEAAGSSERSPAADVPHVSSTRRETLLERTRESISMAPAPQQVPKSKKSHNRARSSIYPVNQFETPRKPRSSTININRDDKRDTTPIEQLLSPDAEYDSIFKSRPRVALSPLLSPLGGSEPNMPLSLDSDLVTSSPLIDVGARR